MATPQGTMNRTGTQTGTGGAQMTSGRDAAESMLSTVDESTKSTTGISLFHILTLGSIGASLALFFSGNKQAGIFVGLWPPTFQALKAVVDKNKEQGSR
ncbi:MAG TPA: hypothetical protein VD966_01035 [Pyrinomonadaceae bacterium]|nr:hypothetical protein [Pyrinomonadaceae bacterium]